MQKLTIVLADDHHVVRQGLRTLLEGALDCSVVGEAADGSAAIELVKRLLPKVLVVDMVLPHLNGLDVIHHVQQIAPQTRIVVLSMHADESYVRGGRWRAGTSRPESARRCRAARRRCRGSRSGPRRDGEFGDRSVGQHMGDVAEGILMHVEPGVGRDVDLPLGDILPVMAAGRHPQDLDHAGGRRLVAIAGGMGNSQAHGVPDLEFRTLRELVMPGLVPGIHVFSSTRQSKTWMAGTSPAMTTFPDIRSNTAW